MKNKDKTGFTLGEVLICMVIIGIVMAMSIQTIKVVKASYTSLTYSAFETVKAMVTAVYAGSLPEAPAGYSGILSDELDANGELIMLKDTTMKCRLSTGKLATILKGLDVEENETDELPYCNNLTGTQSSSFCNGIKAVANTSGSTNCTNLYSVSNASGEPLIDTDYSTSTPNFETTNGQKYYVSQWYYDSSVSSEYGYRLIAIDLNGNSRPNINETEGRSYPDVVTFLIMDNGEIYPLGAAADNAAIGSKYIHYLTARVKGYYYSYNSARTENVPSECHVVLKNNGTVLVDQSTCNYAAIAIQNDSTSTRAFSYREAYCAALGENQTSNYLTYCSGVSTSSNAVYCPPSNSDAAFDLCLVETIKPVFRYNFR